MKLLLDENLSHRLIAAIQSDFPGSVHVRDVGLQSAEDEAIGAFAREHGYTIVSEGCGLPPAELRLRTAAQGGLVTGRKLHDRAGCGHLAAACR